jgi:predicted nucleotide-binding protein (sugar kinase/HSP70/actin superfamily)
LTNRIERYKSDFSDFFKKTFTAILIKERGFFMPIFSKLSSLRAIVSNSRKRYFFRRLKNVRKRWTYAAAIRSKEVQSTSDVAGEGSTGGTAAMLNRGRDDSVVYLALKRV